MTTIRHTYDTGPPATLEEQFVELVCSDEELVQAEFEAIITAAWSTPPPGCPPPRQPARWPPSPPAGHRRRTGPGRPASRSGRPGTGGWTRQRSPPACSTAPRVRQAPTTESDRTVTLCG